MLFNIKNKASLKNIFNIFNKFCWNIGKIIYYKSIKSCFYNVEIIVKFYEPYNNKKNLVFRKKRFRIVIIINRTQSIRIVIWWKCSQYNLILVRT